jgi:hypothetical protein
MFKETTKKVDRSQGDDRTSNAYQEPNPDRRKNMGMSHWERKPVKMVKPIDRAAFLRCQSPTSKNLAQ